MRFLFHSLALFGGNHGNPLFVYVRLASSERRIRQPFLDGYSLLKRKFLQKKIKLLLTIDEIRSIIIAYIVHEKEKGYEKD